MQNNKRVSEIIRGASKEIELLTGSRIVAFLLNEKLDPDRMQKNVDRLKKAVCLLFDMDWKNIVEQNRVRYVVLARHLFFWYATDKLGMSVSECARMLERDHTSVLHGRDKIRDFISINDSYTLEQINSLDMYMEFDSEIITNEI